MNPKLALIIESIICNTIKISKFQNVFNYSSIAIYQLFLNNTPKISKKTSTLLMPKLIISICFILLLGHAHGQGFNKWFNYNKKSNLMTTMSRSGDGNYIIAGHYPNNTHRPLLFFKISEKGDSILLKSIGTVPYIYWTTGSLLLTPELFAR